MYLFYLADDYNNYISQLFCPIVWQLHVLNLMKDDNNIMIHCRVDANQLLLSTRKNGTWLSGTRVEIPYPGLGSAGNVVTLRIQARSDHFYVTINGDDGHKYCTLTNYHTQG